MADMHREPRPHDEGEQALLAAARAERPPAGAKARAFDASVGAVRVGVTPATLAWAGAVRAIPRVLAWATPLLLAVVVGELLVMRHLEPPATQQRSAAGAPRPRAAPPSPVTAAPPTESARAAPDQEQVPLVEQQLQMAAAKALALDGGTPPAARTGAGRVHASQVCVTGCAPHPACRCQPGDALCSCL